MINENNAINDKDILNKKLSTLVEVFKYLGNNRNIKEIIIDDKYFLIYLNIIDKLKGFDYEIAILELSTFKIKNDLKFLFITFEYLYTINYISIEDLFNGYNLVAKSKTYKYGKDYFNDNIQKAFSFFTTTNKNFKSDLSTYLEYNYQDKTKTKTDKIIEFKVDYESLLIADIIKDLKNSLDKDDCINDFIKSKQITDTTIINLLNSTYDLVFRNINDAYVKNTRQETININHKVKKSIEDMSYTNNIESINSEMIDNKIIESNTNSNTYKKVINPFIIPKIKREDKYIICDKVAYYNINMFDDEIKKTIYNISPKANNYSLPYNKNKILLQKLALDEIKDYAKDLIKDLENNNREINYNGFSRIYDIHKNWSNFESAFSIDYRDFINSKAIKEKDYFEIILEYKKGTATRDYLDLFLAEQKNKYSEILHDDEFEAIVDNALYEWERDINTVYISSPNNNINFFKGVPNAPVFSSDEIKSFIPEHIWIENKISLDVNIDKNTFDKIQTLREYYQVFLKTNIEDSYSLLKVLKDNKNVELKLFWFNIFSRFEKSLNDIDVETIKGFDIFIDIARKRTSELNDFYKNSFNSSLKIETIVYEQEKWIFEYNKSILESKKMSIKKALENYTNNN